MIFRLGRLLSGGARGPGVFFIIPCVDIYEKIDMRTQTFDVPPQEVLHCNEICNFVFPEKELRGLSPNFHIHVSVSDLYFPMFGTPIFLQQNRQTNQRNI